MELICIPDQNIYEDYLRSVLSIGCNQESEWLVIRDSLELIKPDLLRRFAANRSKYFRNNEKTEAYLQAYNYSQLVLVLHPLARYLYSIGQKHLSDRVYFSMVSHTSCDIYYEVALPILTSCDHPLGAIIGRAMFSKTASLQFSNGCNLGNNHGKYPYVEGNLLMLPGSAIVGETFIRGNVVMAKGAYLKDAGLIENVIVFGGHPKNIFKSLSTDTFNSHSMFSSVKVQAS